MNCIMWSCDISARRNKQIQRKILFNQNHFILLFSFKKKQTIQQKQILDKINRSYYDIIFIVSIVLHFSNADNNFGHVVTVYMYRLFFFFNQFKQDKLSKEVIFQLFMAL